MGQRGVVEAALEWGGFVLGQVRRTSMKVKKKALQKEGSRSNLKHQLLWNPSRKPYEIMCQKAISTKFPDLSQLIFPQEKKNLCLENIDAHCNIIYVDNKSNET